MFNSTSPQHENDHAQQVTGSPLSPVVFERLLQQAIVAIDHGHTAQGRALLRALLRHPPVASEEDPHTALLVRQAWNWLAQVAETPAERDTARQHTGNIAPGSPPVAPPEPVQPARRRRLTGCWIGGVLLLVAATTWLAVASIEGGAGGQAGSSNSSAVQTLPPTSTITPTFSSTLPPTQTRLAPTPPVAVYQPVTPWNAASPTPIQFRPQSQPPGTIYDYGLWRGMLTSPAHVRVLEAPPPDTSIQGKLVLVLLNVGNLTERPRPLPRHMVVFVASEGERYTPLPQASSRYLEAHGRGQAGDLALEDAIPPGGGLVTVPLLFDLPASTQQGILLFGPYADSGWQIDLATTAAP